jgi:hypothetical protein
MAAAVSEPVDGIKLFNKWSYEGIEVKDLSLKVQMSHLSIYDHLLIKACSLE